MWLLISEKGELFHITPQEEHVVSRKGGSITLGDDTSISRKHAKIVLRSDDENDPGGVTLIDTSSKYGTYLNSGIETSERIIPNEEVILKHDDLIRFGLQWNMFRVRFMPLIVVTSTINKQQKNELKSQIKQLGGKVLSSWSPSCTYLTMNEILLTVKVVCALAAGQYIVTPQYWEKLLQLVEEKSGNLPNPNDFVAPLNEPTINKNQVSFLVNKQRSTLFKSLIFVCSSTRQKECIEIMVTAAGGKVINFSDCKFKKERFCQEGVILMQSSSTIPSSGDVNESQVPPGYKECANYIASKSLRCIPESDIGLAVLYCSCEKFCNPRYKFQNVFERHPVPQPQSELTAVIAQDTEINSEVPQTPTVGKIINETVLSSVSHSSKKPNKRSPDPHKDNRMFKKFAALKDIKNVEKVCDRVNHVDTTLPKDADGELKQVVCVEDSGDHFSLPNSDKKSQTSLTTNNNKKEVVCVEDSDKGFSFSKHVNKMATQKSISVNSHKTEAICIEDSDDEFSFTKPDKKSKHIVSETDGSSSSRKEVNNKSVVLPSVDMFATVKCSTTDRQNDSISDVYKPSASITLSSKKSLDIFDTSVSKTIDDDDFQFQHSRSNKRRRNDSDDDFSFNKKDRVMLDDDDDFSFNKKETRTVIKDCISDSDDDVSFKNSNEKRIDVSNNQSKEKGINLTLSVSDDDNVKRNSKYNENDRTVGSRSSRSENMFCAQKPSVIDNPFEMNKRSESKLVKPSEDIFAVSASSSKRSAFTEDSEDLFSSKRPKIERECDNNLQEICSNEMFVDDEHFVKHIKQEPIEAVIRDERLYDSTVVVVKSLITPLKDLSITSRTINDSTNTNVNFKKFKKATPLKMPTFIDLVPYDMDDTRSTNGTRSCFADSYDSEEEKEDDDGGGWSYNQTQILKQNKTRSMK